ncbi:MAG: hypothetical protein ACOYK8_09145 [Alphaproteobacteria bacterium]
MVNNQQADTSPPAVPNPFQDRDSFTKECETPFVSKNLGFVDISDAYDQLYTKLVDKFPDASDGWKELVKNSFDGAATDAAMAQKTDKAEYHGIEHSFKVIIAKMHDLHERMEAGEDIRPNKAMEEVFQAAVHDRGHDRTGNMRNDGEGKRVWQVNDLENQSINIATELVNNSKLEPNEKTEVWERLVPVISVTDATPVCVGFTANGPINTTSLPFPDMYPPFYDVVQAASDFHRKADDVNSQRGYFELRDETMSALEEKWGNSMLGEGAKNVLRKRVHELMDPLHGPEITKMASSMINADHFASLNVSENVSRHETKGILAETQNITNPTPQQVEGCSAFYRNNIAKYIPDQELSQAEINVAPALQMAQTARAKVGGMKNA